MRVQALIPLVGSLLHTAAAARLNFQNNLNMMPPSQTAQVISGAKVAVAVAAPVATGVSTFQTYLDHNDTSKGTFPLRYYYNSQYYGGEGSPVMLFCGQEAAADEYAEFFLNRTNSFLMELAQSIDAAVIIIEHRYWGESSPYDILTVENLQYLTLKQNIADLTYFAENVRPAFDTTGASRASRAPWVLYGGSYSGAVTGWVASTAPGTFWAYIATSAVVEAVSDFWEYFAPEQKFMPQNCSTDISKVINYIDEVIEGGTKAEKHSLKKMFGLEGVSHDADFVEALVNGPYLWQGNQFYFNEGFFTFCDYIENATAPDATIPGAKGVGVATALAGYANWFYTNSLPGLCESYGYKDFNGTYNVECFNSYNASSPIFNDLTVRNPVDRQWEWMLCNEPFGYWQTAAPAGQPSLVSRSINVQYFTRQCGLYFPTENGYKYGIAQGKTEAKENAWTQGWNVQGKLERIFFVNGQYDPWRDSTVSSDYRPDGHMASTATERVEIIPGAFHCSDSYVANGMVNAGCRAVQEDEISQLKKWIAEYPKA